MTTADLPIFGNPPRYFRCTQVGTDAGGNPVYALGVVNDSADSGDASAANQALEITALQAIQATAGATTGAAVVTDANGTIQQYLRGLVKQVAAKIGVTTADGDSATLGVTTGAAVITDANGTVQQYLRGLVKQWPAGTLVIGTGGNVIGTVGQNGTWTVQPGNTANTTPWLFTNPRVGSPLYTVDAIGYTAYATPTDMICIRGSNTKTVYVTNLSIRMNSTAAALQAIYFIKRSTANTGGTSTNPTPVTADSSNPAATAVVDVYTAAPTTGTAVGNLIVAQVPSTVVTSAGGVAGLNSNSNAVPTPVNYAQSVTLRGVNEMLCINYNGAALTTGFTAGYTVQWIEF